MSTRPFDSNPDMGITRLFHYDEVTDEATIETVADITALAEANQYLRNTEEHDRFSEFRRIGSVPIGVYWQLRVEGKLDDQAYMKKWWNDRDQRVFRTNTERV